MLLGLHQVLVRGRVGLKYYSFGVSYTSRYYSKGPPPGDCKKKPVQCLGEPPALQPKCPKAPEEVCQQGTLKVPPLPKECKSDVKSAPIYDRSCNRPYNNPCLPDVSKTCKCDMVPQPCLAPCERKKTRICLGEPDCSYERRIDWGLRVRQVLLGLGAIIGGLILYRIYGGEKIAE
ncbi:hypothetical protein GE061_003142 [Apolygus lucorum]|uniref:Uncharacterized protein n=1 Tax=Apolygus lucorum TaxID=248454 RepID=A0A8S9X0N8_APOLU|nr:hypothetical protein GE061_003142 [Apolygus lucorum]